MKWNQRIKKLFAVMLALVLTVQAMPFMTVETKADDDTITSGDWEYTLSYDDRIYIAGYTGSDTNIVIPDTIDGYTVTNIDSYAFSDCISLVSVDIPDSVTSIGNQAFSGCTGLIDVAIGSGVTKIYTYAFYGCTSLNSIDIPDSVTSIGNFAFYGCS